MNTPHGPQRPPSIAADTMPGMSDPEVTPSQPWRAPEGRFAASIVTDPALMTQATAAMLGLADDTGVALNNGRPGARLGPQALRAALSAFGTSFDHGVGQSITAILYDAGDIVPATLRDPVESMLETHRRIERQMLAMHRAGLVTIGIGGGHDLTLPCIRAAAQAHGVLGGVNLDPHLDVRDTMGSGMPFRRAIECDAMNPKRFVELGTGRFSNLREHIDWARALGVRVVGFDDAVSRPETVREALAHATQGGKAFVSIDLDVLDGSIAPGVSAVCPQGVPLSMATTLAELAGLHPGVVHFDIMELSPIHDDPAWSADGRPGRTARVAALILLHFLSGLSRRAS